jgi:1-acyl-sn-glycerol-3-phosphate acyltransferase
MIIWSIICISTSLLVRLLTFSSKWGVAMARMMWAPFINLLAGVRLQVHLTNPSLLKTYQGPVIVVSNHASVMDIPFLFQSIPFNLYFIGKKELKKVPFIGWYMMAMGMIFIDRGNKEKSMQSIKKAALLIRNGKSVVTFPEGTRSSDGQIGPFKNGTFHMAIEAKIPILPVYIEGAHHVWPNSKFSIQPYPVQIIIGEPINTDQWELGNLQQYNTLVRNAVLQLQSRYSPSVKQQVTI